MHYFRQGHQQRPIGPEGWIGFTNLGKGRQHACSQTEQNRNLNTTSIPSSKLLSGGDGEGVEEGTKDFESDGDNPSISIWFEERAVRVNLSGMEHEGCPEQAGGTPVVKNELKQLLYRILSAHTGKELPWGTLTGIRPTKDSHAVPGGKCAGDAESHDGRQISYPTCRKPTIAARKKPCWP